MEITLAKGTLEVTGNMSGWVITSDTAVVKGAEDETLLRGDIIDLNGSVWRKGEAVANVA